MAATDAIRLSGLIAKLRMLTSRTLCTPELAAVLEETSRAFTPSAKILTSLLETTPDSTKRRMIWREYVNLVASGKVITTSARAEDALKQAGISFQPSWLSKGVDYAKWLGEDIANLCAKRTASDTTDWDDYTAQLLERSLSLGYTQTLVPSLMTEAVAQDELRSEGFGAMFSSLNSRTACRVLEDVFRWLSTIPAEGDATATFAALIDWLRTLHPSVKPHVVLMLHDPTLSSTLNIQLRRACVASLASSAQDELQDLLGKLITSFADTLFINHGLIIQQEAIAQTILLTAGCVHRIKPTAVLVTARSSGHMQGVSNRLNSSHSRARWLGMVVGTAISSLVDEKGSRMNFGTEDMLTDEAKWYRELVNVRDTVGKFGHLQVLLKAHDLTRKPNKQRSRKQKAPELPIIGGKKTFGPVRPPAQTEVIGEKVTEILGESDDPEDELKPYSKPDEDPEDSDEDATLVNRNKCRPPVYIRDLMGMLRDTAEPNAFQTAIKHAAPLIRRKTNFGGEVKDHAEEIALLLCDLQDPFDTEDFNELRLQALIAVLLSDIEKMAPWLSGQAYIGEYSISQRCLMFSVLGLGGRELAGLQTEDEDFNPTFPTTSFPTKRLAGRLHAMYDPSTVKRLDAASTSIERQMIKPLALSAADKATSHLDVVKIRNFSSRLTDANRTRRNPAPNRLAKIFARAFFGPLVSRYQQEIATYGHGSIFSTTPAVSVTFLKTLALLFHSAGSGMPQILDITAAFLRLLLPLRVTTDVSVSEAVLFSVLTILEINLGGIDGALSMARENGREVMEFQQWAAQVLKSGFGDDRLRALAAGVLVKCSEVMESVSLSM